MSSERAAAATAAASGDGASSIVSPVSAGEGTSSQPAGAAGSDTIAYLCSRFDRNDHAKIEDAVEFYPISLDHNRRRIRRRVAGKSSGDESSDEDPGQAPVIEKVREAPASAAEIDAVEKARKEADAVAADAAAKA